MLWAGNVQLVREEILGTDIAKGQALVGSVQTGFSLLLASMIGGYITEKFENVFYLHLTAFILCLVGILIYVGNMLLHKNTFS